MKKPSKRKLYQKRRKKEKAEQRRKSSKTTIMPETATAASYKYNNNKQYRRNIFNYSSYNQSNPISSYSQDLQLWWQTYCSAIEFHTKQQNAWRDESKHRQCMLLEKYANEYETSSEEEEDDEEYEFLNNNTNYDDENINSEAVEEEGDVDEEYVNFLEVTHKHREELRVKRAEEHN